MDELNYNYITFSRKPIPVPPEYRPLYKIAQIVLALKLSCKKHKASLLQLHLFSWALKNQENSDSVLAHVRNPQEIPIDVWNLEPAINRALYFAVAEKLIEIALPKGDYLLTEKGHTFANLLLNDNSVLKSEKYFFALVKSSITNTLVENIAKKWNNNNA